MARAQQVLVSSDHPTSGTRPSLVTEVVSGIHSIPATAWDACAVPSGGVVENPFLTHRFLAALEESQAVGAAAGWLPCHVVVRHDGMVMGVLPLYLKSHSYGEYVFDHVWADACYRYGGDYYPKLQTAVPFTPVTGPRLLLHPQAPAPATARALVTRAIQLARTNGLSSWHITFCTRREWQGRIFNGAALGMHQRLDSQYHWHNRGYDAFDAFLAALPYRQRKKIRKERHRAQADVMIYPLVGDMIKPRHWDAFWMFYQDTGARKWGIPYLPRAFFEIAHDRLRDDILLVMARQDGEWIGGALNFIGAEALFGRYWGSRVDKPFLHFEVCYYQAIDFAIKNGLRRVEAGAQGAHKQERGYAPVLTHSLHWFREGWFSAAVGDYLAKERAAVLAYVTDHDVMREDVVCDDSSCRRGSDG